MLPRAFFGRGPLTVARDLLGCVITARGVSVRLTEVEAYAGTADPASHAFRGPTPRSAVMFGPPGHLYVYFVYGMHWCANLVCEREGVASAVLLRAGEVVDGQELARQRRPAARSDLDLARGPAKLAGVLALSGADTGADLCRPGSAIGVSAGDPVPDALVRRGPRVGVAAAGEWPWRWWVADDPSVSGYRPRHRRRTGTTTPGAAGSGAAVPGAAIGDIGAIDVPGTQATGSTPNSGVPATRHAAPDTAGRRPAGQRPS